MVARVTPVTTHVPVATEAAVQEHVAAFAATARAAERVLILRAQSSWSGPTSIVAVGRTIRIVEGVSQLAILDELYSLEPEEMLAVVTPLTEDELGSAILLQAYRQRITRLDVWNLVPGLFGVRSQDVDPALRAIGQNWLPEALLRYQPATRWPKQTGRPLSTGVVIRLLLAEILGISLLEEIDAARVLEHLERPDARTRWRELDEPTREGLTTAAGKVLGGHVVLALRAAASDNPISIAAIGLIADVLWPAGGRSSLPGEALAARVRLEKLLGPNIEERDARGLADASIAAVLRREALGDDGFEHILDQAEALAKDLGWEAGAAQSRFTRAGMSSRLGEVGRAIKAWLAGAADAAALAESAVRNLSGHAFAARYASEVFTAQMAVRLMRWMSVEVKAPASLDETLTAYAHDTGWADRALSATWVGSSVAETAVAYEALVERARDRRDREDAAAAALLTGETHAGTVIPVEQLLERVVVPLSTRLQSLIILIDGMSVATATEIAQDAQQAGWVEVLPDGHRRRLVALAALPSLTRFSRTSFFSGALRVGDQTTEKAKFAEQVGGVVFHKDDLRAAGGHELPRSVVDAINDGKRKIVGVVLNTIDDALAKHDPGGTRWNLAAVQHLRALLDAAALAGRAVVLTSDHGHVIERGGDYRPIAGGSGGARWRTVDSGPLAKDEIVVMGSRVLSPRGRAILAVDERLRYMPKAAGYHGGASLAELTVPVILLRNARGGEIPGWPDAVPQTPTWWNESATVGAAPAPTKAARRPARRVTEQTPAMFDVEVGGEHESSLSSRLVASDLYRSQKTRAGRHALSDEVVTRAIDVLHTQGGRAHRDAFGAGLGIATTAIDQTLAALRRLLNVEGYDVISLDRDGVTILLDVDLLREQFNVR